jgi:hypothetical protein
MHIRSSLPLDCGPLDDRFDYGGDTAGYFYECESASGSGSLSSLMRVDAAIGVVIGVVESTVFLGCGLW